MVPWCFGGGPFRVRALAENRVIQSMRFGPGIRSHRDRRRPCRHRSRAGGCAHGQRTLLLTHNIETLGQMSCNPAIGGIGKGHLVKEIDALGGAMALRGRPGRHPIPHPELPARDPRCAPPACRRIGSSTSAPFAACSRSQPNLRLFQQEAADLMIEGDRVVGVVTLKRHRISRARRRADRRHFLGRQNSRRPESHPGGRAGDPPSMSLAARLRELNLRVGRLKTGTPPRIDGRSIDFSGLREQHSDRPASGVLLSGRSRARIRASFPATSPPPTSAPTTSSAAPRRARRCSPG